MPRIPTLPLVLPLVLLLALVTANCGGIAALQRIVQPPRFEQAPERPAEISFTAPSLSNPAGGAGVTVWLQVTNPNPFGFTLTTLDTELMLEGSRAATGSFPLGLPLGALQQTVIPLDLAISFADLPGIGAALRRATTGNALVYELHGTIGIDAGPIGQPTFGPLRLMTGELRVPALR
jgi:hypothetical protein